MVRLLQLHISLIRYLRTELKKKRTINKLIIFFKNTIKTYIKAILQEYKYLFNELDPDFRKQKNQYKKYNQLKVDLQRAIKMLQYIDDKLQKQGLNRQRRRQFWRDFFKDGQVRKEIFDELMKEIK